jgi:hypothetical protein
VRADALGVELLLLTTHVSSRRDALVDHYQRRLDSKGRNVVTPGVEVYYDNALDEPFWKAREIRFTVGAGRDSVDHRFGYLAVLARWHLGESGPWQITLDAGPGLLYRKSWRDVPDYDPDNPLRESEHFLPGYEYLFLVMGEMDLLYRFSPTVQGVWSIFPGIPYVITQALGLRWCF